MSRTRLTVLRVVRAGIVEQALRELFPGQGKLLCTLHGNHAASLLALHDWHGAEAAAKAALALDAMWGKAQCVATAACVCVSCVPGVVGGSCSAPRNRARPDAQ